MYHRKRQLVRTVNKMIELCEPVDYSYFNTVLTAKNVELLREAEQSNPYIGISKRGTPQEGVSVLSIIATITDILIDERLMFILDDDNKITGVTFDDDME